MENSIAQRSKSFLRTIKYSYFSKYPANKGVCLLCELDTYFLEKDPWLRDNYICYRCFSIPRNRALVNVLNKQFPDWRKLNVHESSPGGILSTFLERSCQSYSSSHYYENVERGTYQGKHRSEDLSRLTFDDNTFDLFITSDVFEHVFEPEKAFNEINRVLKPGGAHVFTMPWYPAIKKSIRRVSYLNGEIVNLLEPIYHGNPISEEGSLVTVDWGLDFCDVIYNTSGLTTTIYLEKNRQLGLDAEFLEVFISRKAYN